MTTYTMNGHKHSTRQIQPEILMGIVGKQVAQFSRARWQSRAQPERFSCLASADPRIQLQTALTQIEDLLHKNAQLLETVLLLGQALNDAHSSIHADHSIDLLDRDKLRPPCDIHGSMKQLDGGSRPDAPE
ncbi:hypothetical protein [Wenzhouxiangella sp. EGI_FJ10305]|uniref:hypothetical protein n=1 Tax=Wenzhouxiangella sp. EGI_FJ10305 TaxID=3243768 RepID=UPI0035D734F3